jgi:hypothetical protein
MEEAALRGAKGVLSACKPMLLIERIKSNVTELDSMLRALGYRVAPMGINLLAIHQDDPITDRIKIG